MKGKILGFSAQRRQGLLIGQNKNRYIFDESEWFESEPPAKGDLVFFEPDGDKAVQLVLHKKATIPVPETSQHAPKPVNVHQNQDDDDDSEIKTLSFWGYYVQCWKKSFDFKGRARRKEFWSWQVFNTLFIALLGIVAAILIPKIANNEDTTIILMPFALAMLAAIIPTITLHIRRLHDLNRSGWWALIVIPIILIPYIGFIMSLILGCLDSYPKPNQYGVPPK